MATSKSSFHISVAGYCLGLWYKTCNLLLERRLLQRYEEVENILGRNLPIIVRLLLIVKKLREYIKWWPNRQAFTSHLVAACHQIISLCGLWRDWTLEQTPLQQICDPGIWWFLYRPYWFEYRMATNKAIEAWFRRSEQWTSWGGKV